VRSVSLLGGLFLFAVGIVLLLESDLGLSPWDCLNQGIQEHTPLSFGAANIVVGLVILCVAWGLGQPPGIGTVANAVLVGVFIELLLAVPAIDSLDDQPLAVRIGLLVCALPLFGVGSAFYIGAAMGAGPRDSLMLVMSHRTGGRIGIVRAAIEVTVLVAGIALGGTFGVGTVAFAVLIGPIVETSFGLLARTPLAVPGQQIEVVEGV
jgi:uncharacterized membrane protein YczE